MLPAAKLGSGAEVGPLLNAVLSQFSGLVTNAADSEVPAWCNDYACAGWIPIRRNRRCLHLAERPSGLF
jgi:hypothetical protein